MVTFQILGELFYADQNLCLFIRLDDAESWVEKQIVILDQYFISNRRSTVIHNEKGLLHLTVPIFDKLKTAIRLNTILNIRCNPFQIGAVLDLWVHFVIYDFAFFDFWFVQVVCREAQEEFYFLLFKSLDISICLSNFD